MSRLLLQFSLLALFLYPLSVRASKLVDSDFVVFKVKDTVYMYSDLLEIHEAFKLYSCSENDSFLIHNMDLSRRLTSLNLKQYNGEDDLVAFIGDREKEYISKIIFLVKLIQYSETQNIVLPKNVKVKFSAMAVKKKCKERDLLKRTFPKYVLKLLKVDNYLGTRFDLNSFWVSEQELKELRLKYPKTSEKELVNTKKQEKLKEAVSTFFDSIKKQTSHEKML